MEDILKEIKEDGSEKIIIKTEEGNFELDWGENGDLYIGLFNGRESDIDEVNFTITKENLYLYNAFLNLYKNITEFNPYGDDSIEKESMIWKLLKDDAPINDKGNVEFVSDETVEEEASRFIIAKDDINDVLKLTFKKSNSKRLLNTYFVRINNSRSRYIPFNTSFMMLYDKLKNYQKEHRQIHIEEYIAGQVRRRVRESK